MSITIKRYVDIVSGVGAAGGVAQRDLIGRIFSDNPKTPTNAAVEFDTSDEVGSYYGTSSEEYKRALFYFGFISKSISSPRKLSFGRWAKVASVARIYGARTTSPLSAFTAIVAGTLSLTVGAQTANISALDLSGAASLTAVAALLQTAIRAAAGAQFTTALVTYDALASAFNFSSTTAADAGISVALGTLAGLLGWTPVAIYSPGTGIQTISAALDASVAASNNFGSFAFALTLTNPETIEAGTWNAARNVEFIYGARALVGDAAALSAAMLGLQGTGLSLGDAALPGEYDELVPMIILAATDYNRRNAVQNYMFQQFALTPKVSSDANANLYDGLRVNYYGNTQTAGQQINFYQRGLMMGGLTAPVDMNTYANEVWFKDAAQSAIMALLLALPRIPANVEGRGQVLAILQDVIDRALFNGTISIGKTLTTAQKLFIGEQSGDPDAWHQVQNIGYWVDCLIVPFVGGGGTTEYKAIYTLIYSKDDAVRKVEGTHILI